VYTPGVEALIRSVRDWIEIPSVTGSEGDYAACLKREFEKRGFQVELQTVAPGRANLLARAGQPRVVFCTHLDTVPPFFGSREDSDFIYGRGACDAKGQAAVMLNAGERLLAEGEDRVGFLFTVGEEIDSAGAAFANTKLADPWKPAYVIVGEPTGGRFIRSGKGIYKAQLHASGIAGHSSRPLGPSAVHELVACTHRLLSASWGKHPVHGEGSLNVGQFSGGVAPNVTADQAEASLLIRTVEPFDEVHQRVSANLGEHVCFGKEPFGYAPIEFHVPAGEESETVAFGTDAPYLSNWGTPLLFGPGAIEDAHTDHEKVAKRDLVSAVERHVRVVRDLLAELDS